MQEQVDRTWCGDYPHTGRKASARPRWARQGSGTQMSWTDERIEKLTKMWEGGATASQIAEVLGGVSRNGRKRKYAKSHHQRENNA